MWHGMHVLRRYRVALLLASSAAALIAVVAGCSAPAMAVGVAGPGSVPRGAGSTQGTGSAAKVLLIVMENHSDFEALHAMPFLSSEGRRYAVATHSSAVGHPSLPNYLALTGGSTFGGTRNKKPNQLPLTGSSVFGQALAHGRTAKVYVEAMASPCQAKSTRLYSHLINPWVYFSDPVERQACQRFDVPAGTVAHGAFTRDVSTGRLPTVGMLVPSMCDNAHNCSLTTANRWLHRRINTITTGPDFRSGKLTVLVTFDEDDYLAHNHILTVVMNRNLHHRRIDQPFNHYAVSALLSRFAGGPPLRNAASSPALDTLVHP